MTNYTNNNYAAKCPICGGDELVSMNEPIHDQYAHLNGECYVCAECGYVLWFNKGYVQFVKDRKEGITKLDEEITSLTKQKGEVMKDIHNIDAYKTKLKNYRKELEQRIAWGEGGNKTCRALEESISEMLSIINSGANPDVDRTIQKFNGRILELKKQKEELASPIRPIRIYN